VAELIVDDHQIRMVLSAWERLGALHGDVAARADRVVTIRAVADLWPELRGIRWPGTGWPGVIMLGTTRHADGRDFCAVYGHRPGVVLDLVDGEFRRWLVTIDDAEQRDLVCDWARKG
jgi:hypothetical protein